MEQAAKLIAIHDGTEWLDAYQSDLNDCFRTMRKVYGKVTFSRETKQRDGIDEHYLYLHCDPQHLKSISMFVLGFACGRKD